MKRIFFFSLAIAVLLTSTAGSFDDAKAVQGMWGPVKADLGGQPMTEALLKGISLKLENGTYEVFVGGAPDKGTYTIDSPLLPRVLLSRARRGRIAAGLFRQYTNSMVTRCASATTFPGRSARPSSRALRVHGFIW
jgi:hypothetical protein